jgi:hypothetical protein
MDQRAFGRVAEQAAMSFRSKILTVQVRPLQCAFATSAEAQVIRLLTIFGNRFLHLEHDHLLQP